MPDHIEKRRNLWYATLTVPPDVRDRIGRFKFIESLGTADKRKAVALAAPVIARWRALIRRERGEGDALINEALRWRAVLAEVPEENEGGRAYMEDKVAETAEVMERQRSTDEAERFAAVAFGKATPSELHFDAWKAQLALEPKTVDQMARDVKQLIGRFGTLEEMTPTAVKRWQSELKARGATFSSLKRLSGSWRSYWRYLQSIEAVAIDRLPPFISPVAGRAERKELRGSYIAYTPAEVISLFNAAVTPKGKRRPDTQLAQLIVLAAYTGARIEELCSLRVSQCTSSVLRITDSKTDAGVREVPVHSQLVPLVSELLASSDDGYLLSGLGTNKYEDRSNAIGKRFGRLKAALGFSKRHGFHSIRATVATLLEQAAVPEGLAADILGHEKQTITYGLYSAGHSIESKRQAVERLAYPTAIDAR